jgi:CHAD domain-containing protein
VQWVIARLEDERESARKDCQEGKAPAEVLAKLGSWWGLRESVLGVKEAAPALLAESLHRQFHDFAQQAEMLCAQKDQTPDPEVHLDPHELRIAGKALRYTLEMAQRQGHPLPDDVLKRFKKMQDALGLWHDYVVLAERTMLKSVEHMLPHHDAPMQRAVLDLVRLFLTRAETQLRRFATLWTRSGESLTATILSLAPRDQAGASPPVEKPETND